jgi:hypothetical protein
MIQHRVAGHAAADTLGGWAVGEIRTVVPGV